MKAERDIVDLLKQTRFLGQEFLTWLWFKADERGGAVLIPGHGDIGVTFERFMILEEGEGESNETLTCRGLQTDLEEARAGLRSGKKVARAHIRLAEGDEEWRLTLDGASFDIYSLKLRKTLSASEDEGDDLAFEGRVLERAFLMEQAVGMMDRLFNAFLGVRLEPGAWAEEKHRLRTWIHRG